MIINNNKIIRFHVFISGKVQGVSYRFYTEKQAQALGVNGWVRNLADRRVEAVFEGEEKAVQSMLKWCEQGSPHAVVNEVISDEEIPEGIKGFRIVYS
jgi:acylphosphatase